MTPSDLPDPPMPTPEEAPMPSDPLPAPGQPESPQPSDPMPDPAPQEMPDQNSFEEEDEDDPFDEGNFPV